MDNKNLINIEGFGKQELYLNQIEGTNEIYVGFFYINEQKYISILDIKGRALIPFTTKKIVESFKTNDNLDYCFTISDGESYESYHLFKDEDEYKTRKLIEENPEITYRLIGSEVDNYWLAYYKDDIEEMYAIYDVKRKELITPFVTNIEFIKDKNSKVFAYLEKVILCDIENEISEFTTLACYINKNGSFITPLLDMEDEMYYETTALNFDPEFAAFYYQVENIRETHKKNFYEKQERISEYLSYMRTGCLSENNLKVYKKDCKIIPFTRGENNDKK